MEIINFEKVKARKQLKVRNQSKHKVTKHLPETDDHISELQRQYREYAEFCNQWYYDHVIGRNKDGKAMPEEHR